MLSQNSAEVRRWLARAGLFTLLAGALAPGPVLAQDEKGDAPPPRVGPMPPGGRGLLPPGGPLPPEPEPADPQGGARPAETTVSNGSEPAGSVNAKKVPCVQGSTKVTMDYMDAPLMDVTKYMAEITCRNFILSDDLKGQITIISHQQVTVGEAYEAYLSALEVAGYTTVMVGKNTKVVPTSKAGNVPLRVYHGDNIPETDNFVTQIIQLDNVTVSDVSTVVKEMAGSSAKVIAYAPTNTLIITDAAYNIRRVYRIVRELDVAAPKSELVVLPIRYATAADVQRILEQVYGVAATSTASSAPAASGSSASTSRRRGRRDEPAEPAATSATATNVGTEGSYISKIIADERTNSLIVLANSEAITKIKELVEKIDIDIDPRSRSQIHVIYLDHAKATDVANVLSSLSDSRSGGGSGTSPSRGSSGSSRTSGSTGSNRARTSGSGASSKGFNPGMPGGAGPDGGGAPGVPGGGGSVVAAFDSGMRITADENTNSLVIIAAPEDFQVLKGVIDRLDIPRRQVYVEAVVVEVGSTDETTLGLGVHGGAANSAGGLQFGSAQLGANTLQFDVSSVLSGFAMGVFGPSISTGLTNPLDGSDLTIPAFGIALTALASNSEVNILSNPNLLVVDNEEATITVGRNVPFPVSSGYSTNGLPVTSYQREDVGITLKVTPQINESNYVTMELQLEVAEVEEDSSSLDVNTAGFITSKRQVENVVVVQDNQTIVIGGLIGNTKSEVQTKIPILGDIPIIGLLFRGKKDSERKTNLLIFLTPHVINEAADLEEVYRVKMAQRDEFVRRFYGKSREEQEAEFQALMQSSMNLVDRPSIYRTKPPPHPRTDEIASDPPVTPPGTLAPGTGGAEGTPATDPTAPTPAPEVVPEPAPDASGGQ